MSPESRSKLSGALLAALVAPLSARTTRAEPFELTRLVAHWADYADPGYLPFIDEAQPDAAQVGFYGAHFWSLADTPHGGGYPAHFPVRGHRECAAWFARLNAELHARGVKVIGHMNVKFLIGDPEGPEGPRGFFRFYKEGWDEDLLGPKPAADPLSLLERDRKGAPISGEGYRIGGMREYWACLLNPHWREVLKAWVRFGIAQGVDGFVVNYFYRHDCHCRHCVDGFRRHLGERFPAADLRERFGIENLAAHDFEEIGAWHDPTQSTPLRLEALRFSQSANKAAFDEVFVRYGRGLRPDLIVAQWNHLGDFNQIDGDERSLLPAELWARGEDYLWYSTGGAANSTDLKSGVLGEGTLQARYIRGASGGKPFTLGKYEGVRIRAAIAELAANGGAPMGFYTSFKDPDARREIVRYYGFLRRHESLYLRSRAHAEVLLLFPRRGVYRGEVAAVARFKEIGRRLLDAHVLFDVLPDDLRGLLAPEVAARYVAVVDPGDPALAPEALAASLPSGRSRFEAPSTVRVSASRPAAAGDELAVHLVNYDREERATGDGGAKDERPLPTPEIAIDLVLPDSHTVETMELLTPEADAAIPLAFESDPPRVRARVPSFLVYAVLRLRLAPAVGRPPAVGRLERRVPWTASRVVGSPEPPLPYTVERTFRKISWRAPLYVAPEPGSDHLLVVEQGGEKDRPSRILRVRDDPEAERAATFLEVADRLVYSVAFHPGYRENGKLFVFTNGPTAESERANRVARFTLERRGEDRNGGGDASRRCDPASEEVLIEWRSAGHDGGGLAFGRDGMLYVSSGDGTGDSDDWLTGQDLRDLLGGVLRLDVDRAAPGRPYSIPPDNPFLGIEGARGELWAYGLRNPWRLSVDEETGDVWVGNNGQDLWETVHRVRRGDNCGWSVYEGSHPFSIHRERGPTPIVPPTAEHHHAEARSLTGGVVYHGEALRDLDGAYIYGDYSTGKIWGLRSGAEPAASARTEPARELADTTLQIAGFGVGKRGDLLVVDHGGGLYRLAPAPPEAAAPAFPRRLSETGLFLSTEEHRVHPGIIPYSINAPAWTDGARAERFLALPGEARIDYTSARAWGFPDGTVLFETLWDEPAGLQRPRPLETRLLARQEGEWAAYSYRWLDDRTDAELVPAAGADAEIATGGTGGTGRRWRFPARAECLSCHSRAADFVLGLSELQIDREVGPPGARESQLELFARLGLFTGALPRPPGERPRLVDPRDASFDLDARARSYLHANCSSCHVEAGGGNSRMELELSTPLSSMNLVSAHPQHGTLGVANALLVAPGEPERSVLHLRVGRRGRAQMPPLVSSVVDEEALRLLGDWIRGMKPERRFVREWRLEDILPALAEVGAGRSFESGAAAFRDLGCGECHRFGGEGGGAGPDLGGAGRRLELRELAEAVVAPSAKVLPEHASTVIETRTGDVFLGRVEREDGERIVLRGADAFAAAVTVLQRDVAARSLAAESIMPRGLLDTLTREEVLDLLAYLRADGRRDDPAFGK